MSPLRRSAIAIFILASTHLEATPEKLGSWGAQFAWPIIPIHAVLTAEGRVFTFGTDEKGAQGAHRLYSTWDPMRGTSGHRALPNKHGTDSFCGAAALLPGSGGVLIPGGDRRTPDALVNTGIKDTLLLSKDAQSLDRTGDMSFARWYPTATTLPSGSVLIHGGRDEKKVPVQVPEVFEDGRWRQLIGASNSTLISNNEQQWFYPKNFVAPDGRIFGMSGPLMYYMNPEGDGQTEIVGRLPDKSRSNVSSAVMYEPGKILQIGGTVRGDYRERASRHAIEVDITGKKPIVTQSGDMTYQRHWANATVLPTGQVLVTGGSAMVNQLVDPVLHAEIWDPKTKTFTTLAAAQTPRLYHSIALLLPDASVLVGGGGSPGPLTNLNAEIFYPPYLYGDQGKAAKRPMIGSLAESQFTYEGSLDVPFSEAETISRVTLVRNGSVTHSVNMDQRFLELDFKVEGNVAHVTMPKSPNLAPPGYYMLFLLNNKGVPSIARIISLL